MTEPPDRKVSVILVGCTEASGQWQYFFKAMRDKETVLNDTLVLDHKAKESEIKGFAKDLKAKAANMETECDREIV